MRETNRKGIILAGGAGARLYPSTQVLSKQLLPVFDKPMVYYPLSTLMLAGIREILVISTPEHLPMFKQLLGDGSKWGLNLSYEVQEFPGGLAQAFQIGAEFLQGSPCALILGDNIFHANDIGAILQRADSAESGARIFAYQVKDPKRFGIVNFDRRLNIIDIEEKPELPSSNFAVTGLYFYDSNVCDLVNQIKPSRRGELEITDLNKLYLKRNELSVEVLGRGCAWLDTGTHDSLLEAGNFISVLQNRQGLIIGCPEEIAFNNGWITTDELKMLSEAAPSDQYRSYLERLINNSQD
jgi:glucose-1-phosphate thymidylyltransferase